MDFPPLRAYLAAIKDKKNIKIPFFQSKSMQIFLNRRGVPYMSVGGFGAVFRYKDKNDTQYALKVFTRDAPGRAARYKALHDTLGITKFPFMVDFQYVQEGVKVGNSHYPVVVMEWGKGIPINSAVSQDLDDDGILQSNRKLAGNLFSIVKVLQEWKMGHGDFQEGNLLVRDDNNIVLIDYDGMFVPSLEGKRANEIGLADYQHPDRKNSHFGSAIDDFALISIMFQLAIINPKLWKKHHDDKRLILRQKDYKNPKKNPQIQAALQSKEPHVQELAKHLLAACSTDPLTIKAVEKIEANKTIMDWIILPEKTKTEYQYSSIIEKVVALTDEEITEFEANNFQAPQPTPEGKENQAQLKKRKEDEGSWGFISNLLFEQDEDNQSGDNPNKTTIGKFKKSIMGLFFEEEEEEQKQTTSSSVAPAASSATGANAHTAAKPNVTKTASDPKAANTPTAVASPKQAAISKAASAPKKAKADEEKQANTPAKKETETPVPDWLKRRRKQKE